MSWRPKLLLPSDPIKSLSVLNPRKSMVLSVISKRASRVAIAALADLPARRLVRRRRHLRLAGDVKPSSISRSINWSIISFIS